jgi:tetratricopeptide (TPR) repeat protein
VPQQASADFQFARQMNPCKDKASVDHALYNEAVLNKHLGDYFSAMRIYESLHAENPDDAILLNAIGNLYNFFGGYENTVSYYQRALLIQPDSYIACYNLELTYLMQLQHQKPALNYNKVRLVAYNKSKKF